MEKRTEFDWQGRTDSIDDWAQYRYHQVIQKEAANYALIGFSCDEGVRRNKGRVGAKDAPDALRGALANMPWRLPKGQFLADAGTIICEGEQMEAAQQALGDSIREQLLEKRTPIILGGGHETFYGHYLGARSFLGADKKIGMINIDAHFDMRPYEEQTSSGTMFRQILEADAHAGYLVLGIQRYGNTESLFNTADRLGCEYVLEEDLSEVNVKDVIADFTKQYDAIIVTLCMDVVDAAAAPGVSAPSVFGVTPKMVRRIIQAATGHPKALSFDIAEVNPSLDCDGRTVKLGAAFVNEAIMAFAQSRK